MAGIHRSVLAAQDPVPESHRPAKDGNIVMLPVSKREEAYGQRFIQKLKEVKAPLADDVSEKTVGIIWQDHTPQQINVLEKTLKENKQIQWIQLPMAGVNAYSNLIKSDVGKDRLWTSAKGAYAQPVAEHALMLALALLRYLPTRVMASSWGKPAGESLFGQNVVIVGAGGIALSLIDQLSPFNCKITVLRRSVQGPWPQEFSHVQIDSYTNLSNYLPSAGVIFIAAAATAETANLFSAKEFAAMNDKAVVVNVARGELIKTDDLVVALEKKQIMGAGLDVTAPEPLPEDHKLWKLNKNPETNLIITPHTADTPEQIFPLLTQRYQQNVAAVVNGDGNFVGRVDTSVGY